MEGHEKYVKKQIMSLNANQLWMSRKLLLKLHASYRMKNLVDVSRSTMTQRLHDVELFNRIDTKKLLISKKNKA